MSSIVVMKFGGTSVGAVDLIKNVALQVRAEVQRGHQVVVVVSAMAGVTNQLSKWVQEAGGPDALLQADADTVLASGEQVTSGLLALALRQLGMKARSWQGWQVALHTDEAYSSARLSEIDTAALQASLNDGYVAVVSGFQGLSPTGRITTLGRGGSDTSAVALAAALKARTCDIYTDVDGVYTADPRIVAKAKKLDKITYEEMLELASQGAKVLQTRSIELAMKEGVVVRVLSSFVSAAGTFIMNRDESMETQRISGLAYSRDEARITVGHLPKNSKALSRLFGELSAHHIPLDMIMHNLTYSAPNSPEALQDLSFTVPLNRLEESLTLVRNLQETLNFQQLSYDREVAKISIVGIGLRSHGGVTQQLLQTLDDLHIDLHIMVSSETKISFLISRLYLELALRALHSAYGLDALSPSTTTAA